MAPPVADGVTHGLVASSEKLSPPLSVLVAETAHCITGSVNTGAQARCVSLTETTAVGSPMGVGGNVDPGGGGVQSLISRISSA